MKPEPLFHFGRIVLNPAVNRSVIGSHAAFLKHFFQLAIADPLPAIPATGPEDNFAAIMPPFEISVHCECPLVLREHLANPDYLQQGPKAFHSAAATLAGIEVAHMIRK